MIKLGAIIRSCSSSSSSSNASTHLRNVLRLGAQRCYSSSSSSSTTTDSPHDPAADNTANNDNNNNNSTTSSSASTSSSADQLNSSSTRKLTTDITDAEIKKSVFISQSYDIFTNLALEDWLYRHFDFSRHHVLLLWANDPCVIVGRHQNPFVETNVSQLADKGITLARRNSGGGTVYEDRGNLNCTFFTPRERYNRIYNLNIVTRALFREWAIKAEINNRDDIVLNDKKISGTAAKLGHPNAYHHCTLLVNANKANLRESLVHEEANYISKATSSKPVPIRNLIDVNRTVNVPQLLSAVGYEFLRTSATALEDGGSMQTQQQRGFQLINPTEKWFPGISALREEFATWDWIVGKTPKFTVEKELYLKADDKQHKITLTLEVEKGLMNQIYLMMPNNERVPVVSALQGKAYNERHLNGIISALKLVSTDNVKQAINGL